MLVRIRAYGIGSAPHPRLRGRARVRAGRPSRGIG